MTPASLGARTGAGAIDLVLQVAAFGAFAAAFGTFETGDDGAQASVSGGPAVLLAAIVLGYFFLTELTLGGSVGKLLLGLQVVTDEGTKPSAVAIGIRTLLRIVDGFLFYLVAFVAVAVSPQNQRLGDMAAKTAVVKR